MKRKIEDSNQLSLFNVSKYERDITEASIDCDGVEPISSHVPREIVERANFSELDLHVGDTFIFSTDCADRHSKIIYQSLNGEIATIENLNSSGHRVGRIEISFASGRRLWLTPEKLASFYGGKSSHVPREIVERANYQWVETYPVKQRHYYYRYSWISRNDGIERVNKRHIPGGNTSIREGRAQFIREAIASGKTPSEIVELIKSWSTSGH